MRTCNIKKHSDKTKKSKNDYILRESTIIQDLKFANAFIGFLFYIVFIVIIVPLI